MKPRDIAFFAASVAEEAMNADLPMPASTTTTLLSRIFDPDYPIPPAVARAIQKGTELYWRHDHSSPVTTLVIPGFGKYTVAPDDLENFFWVPED